VQELGLREGDEIASLMNSEVHMVWARTARLHIVSEIDAAFTEAPFWSASPETQRRVLEAFRSAGVKAVISRDAPRCLEDEGWRKVGTTGYCAQLFSP
jgi:hypothetical protein